jgi:hypothetical protein
VFQGSNEFLLVSFITVLKFSMDGEEDFIRGYFSIGKEASRG